MHPVLCTNTHYDVTDLVNHGMVKVQKLEYLENGTYFFLRNKKILNLCLRWHILRSYRFLAEVTFKDPKNDLINENSTEDPITEDSKKVSVRIDQIYCFI